MLLKNQSEIPTIHAESSRIKILLNFTVFSEYSSIIEKYADSEKPIINSHSVITIVFGHT